MQRLIFISVFILIFQLGVKSQTFTVNIDTLNLDIKDLVLPASRLELTQAVKYTDKYFCFFKENGLYSFKTENKIFLIISKNGTILQNPEVPQAIKNSVYFDFFIRNDSLLAKTYMDHECFYFDLKKSEWNKIKEVDDRVYEDNDFEITYLDFGEWGQSTWFIDKKTKKEYVIDACGTTINLLNGKYYLTNGADVREIENPIYLKQCDSDYYYSIVEKDKKFHQSSNSLDGSRVIYKDKTFAPESYKEPIYTIITSFVSNNQLYHLCSDSKTTYIAKIENEKLIPVQIIGNKYSVFDWYYSYRGNNLNNSSRFLKFGVDNNTFGFVEINNNKIDIHYIRHNMDSVNYTGSNGFSELINFVIKNMDNFSLKQVDSIERSLGGLDMRSNKIGISHNGYYPVIYNSLNVKTKEYVKVEDRLIAQTIEYLYTDLNKKVKSIFIEWSSTVPYKENISFNILRDKNQESIERFKRKFEEIKQTISGLAGKEPKKNNRSTDNLELTWILKNGLVIDLHGFNTFEGSKEIRMIIYKK